MYLSLAISHKHLAFTLYETLDPASKLRTQELPSRHFQKYRFATKFIADVIADICQGQQLHGIAISFAGDINAAAGKIIDSYSYPSWIGNSITHDLDQFGCPVVIENDAVISALGLYFHADAGAAEAKRIGCIYFAREEGIGAAAINKVDGKLLVYPIAVGHLVIVPDGRSCDCGQKGCLEQYIGGKGVIRTYDIAPEEVHDDEIFITTARYLTQGIMTLLIFYPLDQLYITGEDPKLQRTFLHSLADYSTGMLQRKFVFKRPTIAVPKNLPDTIANLGNLAYFAHRDDIVNMRFAK